MAAKVSARLDSPGSKRPEEAFTPEAKVLTELDSPRSKSPEEAGIHSSQGYNDFGIAE